MSHSVDIFVRQFGVQPTKMTPLKSGDRALALKTQGRGSSEKMFSQEVEKADPLSV